jgi:hypothetical protein
VEGWLNHFQLRADSIQDLSCDSLSPGRRVSQPGRFVRKRSRSDVGKNLKICGLMEYYWWCSYVVDWWNITDKVLTEKKKGRLSGRMIDI